MNKFSSNLVENSDAKNVHDGFKDKIKMDKFLKRKRNKNKSIKKFNK